MGKGRSQDDVKTCGVDVGHDRQAVTGETLGAVPHQEQPLEVCLEQLLDDLEEGLPCHFEESLVLPHAAALPAHENDPGYVVLQRFGHRRGRS